MKKYYWFLIVLVSVLCINTGCNIAKYDNNDIQNGIVSNKTEALSSGTPTKNTNTTTSMHIENTNPPTKEAEVRYTASFITPLFKSASLHSEIIDEYKTNTEVIMLSHCSRDWNYVEIDGNTGYILNQTLSKNAVESIENDTDDTTQNEYINNIVESVSAESVYSLLSVRFKNLSNNLHIAYDFAVMPYDENGECIYEKIAVLSADIASFNIGHGDITPDDLLWDIDCDFSSVDVCVLRIVYYENNLSEEWYNPYVGEWLLGVLPEKGK